MNAYLSLCIAFRCAVACVTGSSSFFHIIGYALLHYHGAWHLFVQEFSHSFIHSLTLLCCAFTIRLSCNKICVEYFGGCGCCRHRNCVWLVVFNVRSCTLLLSLPRYVCYLTVHYKCIIYYLPMNCTFDSSNFLSRSLAHSLSDQANPTQIKCAHPCIFPTAEISVYDFIS